MTDEIDIAQERTADYLARCIGVARGIKSAPGIRSHYCEDCGDEIPEARRIANPEATRCIGCQSGHERGR